MFCTDVVGFLELQDIPRMLTYQSLADAAITDNIELSNGIHLLELSPDTATRSNPILAVSCSNLRTFCEAVVFSKHSYTEGIPEDFVADKLGVVPKPEPQYVDETWSFLGYSVYDCWLGVPQWMVAATPNYVAPAPTTIQDAKRLWKNGALGASVALNEYGIFGSFEEAQIVREFMDVHRWEDAIHLVVGLLLVSPVGGGV